MSVIPSTRAARPSVPANLESTAHLLSLVRDGDDDARERLTRRYLAPLRRWAHGRLPPVARGLVDTQDLVQVTLVKALAQIRRFEPRREGAFLAYLRQILINELRMEIRKAVRRPQGAPPVSEMPGREDSPLEAAIGAQTLDIYERALARLTEEEREGIILRLELGFTHQQTAEALGKPSPDAARMVVARALAKLTEIMDGAS